MNAKIIDGKTIAATVREDIKQRADEFRERTGVTPGLAVIIVGTNPASSVYVRNKQRACEEVGFYSEVHEFSEEITTSELMNELYDIIHNEKIHGILVQLPLPPHLNTKQILDVIPPHMDVDAFHPYNVGKIMIGNYDFLPCTPAGIMKMLEYEDISIDGKECVVIGRSDIVGKPMAMLLLAANGTVTICHSRTKNLAEITRRADILVSAVGKVGFVTAEMVKPGAVVIDVGINRNASGKLVGDVDFAAVSDIASAITPVPGGVGVMTVTMLLENTLMAAELQHNLKNSQEPLLRETNND